MSDLVTASGSLGSQARPCRGSGSARCASQAAASGAPQDRSQCVAVLRRAVEQRVRLIDTPDSSGPHVAEEIIKEALHPYDGEVVVPTTAGLTRNGPDVIDRPGGPERLGPRAW